MIKATKNTAYLNRIDRSMEQLARGKGNKNAKVGQFTDKGH
jgi:hypothetical protein